MATVAEWLRRSTELRAVSASPRLDVEVLLAHCLAGDRGGLFAHPERVLTPAQEQQMTDWLARRREGEPVAYLIGEKEFWGLSLAVAPAVLIPRPDTECLVEQALAGLSEDAGTRVLDLGTGSGAVALAIATERPRADVVAVDRDPAAVALARANACRLGLSRVTVACSDWFTALAPTDRYDVIVSNPPYLATDDPHLAGDGVCREPRAALVATDDGMAALAYLADAAPDWLRPGGRLLLEHGADQGAAVRERLRRRGFAGVDTVRDLAGRERVTRGHWPC